MALIFDLDRAAEAFAGATNEAVSLFTMTLDEIGGWRVGEKVEKTASDLLVVAGICATFSVFVIAFTLDRIIPGKTLGRRK